MKQKYNNYLIGSLCAITCEALYGLSYIFTKNATRETSSLSLLGWRFLVAFIIMTVLALTRIIKIDLKGKSLRPLLTVAFFCPVIYFIGETFGISRTTASESGAFLACIPVSSLIASSIILKKKPTRFQIAGILITLSGVLVTVFAEKADNYSGAEITYIMLSAGALIFAVLALAEAILYDDVSTLIMLPINNSDFMIAVFYQEICCSVLAFFLSNVEISKIGVNQTSSFIRISTIVSIVAGAFFLDEKFTILQIIGVIVITAGVYTSNFESMNSRASR